ncbi:uncharacterized protein LOC143282888 isoform X2 [Babylonia areolata]
MPSATSDMINSVEEGSQPLLGHPEGMSMLMTAVFMVGEMAGSGVLALPFAVEATGWIGLVLIPMCGLISSYTGGILGQCWQLLQQRYPDMRGPVRYPYPAIGMKTFGKPGRIIISASINFTLFGVSCVFLLLAAQNVHSVCVDHHLTNLPFCYWLIILLGLMYPLCLLGTPKDFKFVAMLASAATSAACVILVVLMFLDQKDDPRPVVHAKIEWLPFAGAFGTICFAFGGHPTFPTFQNDMREPHKFSKACMIAYSVMVVLYLPVATAGYFLYGNLVQENILQTVSAGAGLIVIQVFITIHLFCSFIIVINPLCQELEEFFKVPLHFGYKRVLLRTGVVGLVLVVAESVPHFGAILSLIGASSTALLAYIAPPICYFKLCRMKGDWPEIHVSPAVKVALWEIGVVTALAGCVATYSAFTDLLSPGAFTVPCFVNVTAAGG